jgi:glycosyltransferase involved in cell wall biosynthesis
MILSGGLRTKNITKQSLPEQPLITVVTVVRNGEKTLEETILSVINQTYRNVEYIIVDGASTDGTLDIIREYEDRIDYWMSEKDNGVFSAMNKGIAVAKGNFIGFLNSGDYYEFKAVEIIVDKIKNNQYIGVIYGNTNLIISVWGKRYFYTVKPSPVIDHNIKIAPLFCHQSSFVSKKTIERYGDFDEVKVAGDWLYFVRLYDNAVPFFYIDEQIANYLDGGISTTAKGFKESFPYKKKFGTFKKIDYLRLLLFYIKGLSIYKNYIYPIRWTISIFINPKKYWN